MAAVAAFNGRAKQADPQPASPTTKELDPKVVDAEFEEVLVSVAYQANHKEQYLIITRNREISLHINALRCGL